MEASWRAAPRRRREQP